MHWKEEVPGVFHLWEDIPRRSVANVSLQGDEWLWRMFPDSIAGDGPEDPIAARQLREWGFDDLISVNVRFLCLEGISSTCEDAKATAERTIGAIVDKALEAHATELAERFPTLPGIKHKPTTWQLAGSIAGPYLRPSLQWGKWSLIALTIIFILHKVGILDEWSAAVAMPTAIMIVFFIVLMRRH